MTKPIEGWVVVGEGKALGNDKNTILVYKDETRAYREAQESSTTAGRGGPESFFRDYTVDPKIFKQRPVRITFTDEETPEQQKEHVCNMSLAELEEALKAKEPLPDYEVSVTRYKRLELVRNDQYDKQVEEALREFKERVWKDLMLEVGEDCYSENAVGEKEFVPPSEQCLRRIIFGEEK